MIILTLQEAKRFNMWLACLLNRINDENEDMRKMILADKIKLVKKLTAYDQTTE
jgi:hypothetical protein